MSRQPKDRGKDVEAQAAAWVARLGYESRNDVDEAAFRLWLAEDQRHRDAFEEASATWQLAAGLGRSEHRYRSSAPSWDRRVVLAGGLAAAGVAGVVAWAAFDAEDAFATAFGEQRRISLADGSLMILDSDTAVKVRLTSTRRSVTLLRGRAHFDVAKESMRPFVVTARERRVVAVGTAFDVSRAGDTVTVLLVEGRVAVEPLRAGADLHSALMTPGDRMVFAASGEVRSDRPDMATLTAWQNGRLVFDNETLASAVMQMNRYSRRPLVIRDPAVSRLLVSGIYTAGDVEAFANSLSVVLPVEVQSEAKELVLVAARDRPAPKPLEKGGSSSAQ